MANSINLKFALLLVSLAVLVLACNAQFEPVPHDCPPYEEYLKCGPNCQTECATLNERCTIVHIRCPDGCYCIEGYARDENSRCIPINQCKNSKTQTGYY